GIVRIVRDLLYRPCQFGDRAGSIQVGVPDPCHEHTHLPLTDRMIFYSVLNTFDKSVRKFLTLPDTLVHTPVKGLYLVLESLPRGHLDRLGLGVSLSRGYVDKLIIRPVGELGLCGTHVLNKGVHLSPAIGGDITFEVTAVPILTNVFEMFL